jgi:hypothetical protein
MRSWGFGKRERLKCSIEVCSSESGGVLLLVALVGVSRGRT